MRAARLAEEMGDSGGARWFRAPGRVNLIGDHTDYNEGFVLPMAIDRECVIVSRPRRDHVVSVVSLDFPGGGAVIPADGSGDPSRVEPQWARLVAGVVRVLAEKIELAGIDAAVASTVPTGAGLSSSAAFEVACALALLDAAGTTLPPAEIARACQRAEREATGVPCGVMDQLAAISGRAGHGLLIDCRSLIVDPVPLPDELAIFAVHSGLPRALADTEYAERRAACERIAASLGLGALRDASLEQVLDEPYARHVVTENLRVLVTARALRNRERETIAGMFADSHKSLRDDYRVSTPELDALVDALKDAGAVGARLTGAGFGGCVVAIADSVDAARVAERALSAYRNETGLEPTLYWCRAADGGGPVEPEEVAD